MSTETTAFSSTATKGQKIKSNLPIILNHLCAIGVILLITVPLLALTRFILPAADDFSNAHTYASETATSGFVNMLLHGLSSAVRSYVGAGGGQMFTTAFVTMAPVQFYGFLGNALACTAGMLLYFASLLFLVRSVMKKVLQLPRWIYTLWVYAAALFLTTQFVNPAEFFYWYTGFCVYGIPLINIFFTLGFACHALAAKPGRGQTLALIFTALFLFVSCSSTLLFVCVLFASFTFILLYAILSKYRNRKKVYILYAVLLIGTTITVLAPSNFTRLSKAIPASPLHAAWLSVEKALFTLSTQLPGYMVVFTLALLVPLFIVVAKKCTWSFRYPLLVVLAALAVYTGGFFPYMLAYSGEWYPIRYEYAMWIFLVMLLLVCAFYVTGWLVRKHDFALDTLYKKLGLYVVAALGLLISLQSVPASNWVSVRIIDDLANGTIATSYEEEKAIYSMIEAAPEADVSVPPQYHAYPYLRRNDLQADSEHWINNNVAYYYGKASVTVTEALPPAIDIDA